jgi:hypothetical protein
MRVSRKRKRLAPVVAPKTKTKFAKAVKPVKLDFVRASADYSFAPNAMIFLVAN